MLVIIRLFCLFSLVIQPSKAEQVVAGGNFSTPLWMWIVLSALVLLCAQLAIYIFFLKKQIKKRAEGLKGAFVEIQEQERLLALIYNNTRDFIGLMQVVDADTFVVRKLPDWLLDKIIEKYPQYHVYQILNMEISQFYRSILNFDPEEIDCRKQYAKDAIRTRKPIYFEEDISPSIGLEGTAESVMIPIFKKETEVTHILYVSRDVTQKRMMIDELQKSEEKMRMAVQTVPIMLNAFDENGQIVVWNNQCEEVTGYSAAEMIGNPHAFKLLYPDDEYRKKLFLRWKKSKNYDDETIITCKDGGKRIIAWMHRADTYPIPGWDDWGVGVDITQRREAEIALTRSEQQLASMMANLPGMAWRLKIDKDFTIIFISDGVQELLNMSREEFMSKGYKPRDFIVSEYQDLVRSETLKSVKNMTASELVIPLQVGDKVKWALNRFKPVRLADGQIVMDGLLIDISDKLESEQRLQMAIEGAREGMWDLDIEGNVLKLNKYAMEMLGFGNPVITHAFDKFFEVLHEDDLEATKKALEEHLEGITPYYEREYRLRTKDGGWKWIQTRGRVVQRRSDGTPLRAIGTHIDINDRKMADFALQEQKQLLSSLMANLPGMAYRLDVEDNYKATFVSEGSLQLFDIPKEKVMQEGISPWDLVLPEYYDAVRSFSEEHVAKRLGGEQILPVKSQNGQVKWVLDRFRVVEIENRPIIDGLLIDITEKLENEQRLQLAIEGARQGTWDWDVRTDALSYNDYMAKMLGYEPHEMEGNARFFYGLLHPEDKDGSIQKLKQYLRGQTELFEQEYRILTKSGDYKWI
ncbi:MAG: PAS domain-containing protein, partial [Bacteroidota bacterium]